VTEKEPARVKPFEEVKAELGKERQKQVLYDKIGRRLPTRPMRCSLKCRNQAEIIAQSLKVNYYHVVKGGRGEAYPTVGLNVDLDDAIFDGKQGGVTNIIQAANNKLVIGAVQEISPSRQAELAEVEGPDSAKT